MKRILVLAMFVFAATLAMSQSLSRPPSGDNQKSKVTQWIGPVEVSITYSSPDVHAPNGDDRKGKIYGTSVAHYGYIDQGFGPSKAAPWRAGANENTIITFSNDVKIEGKDLKAGTYGLFLALAESGPVTWIFSKNSSNWGSYYYDKNEDALRVDVSSQDAPYTEYLTYGFDDRKPSSAVAYLQWENKKFPFKIEAATNEIYVSLMRTELRLLAGFDAHNYATAAQFAAQNKINLDEALVWANTAMDPNFGGVKDFNTLSTKSSVLRAMGNNAEADAAMDEAIKIPNTPVGAIHQYGRTLLAAGQKEKAMQVFQYNAKIHPEEKFTPNVGLARGYTAMGDKKNAIKYWELAIKNMPENQKPNQAAYEAELAKLKS